MYECYGRKTKGSDPLCVTEGKQGDTQDIVKRQSRSLVKGNRLRDQHEETVAITVMR